MAELDYKYIEDLVDRAKSGDSDSFAELYAATYQKQYLFSYCYLKDEFLAQDALQETYILALKNLGTIRDSKLFVSWLNQINFRVCFAIANRQKKWNAEMAAFDDQIENRASLDTGPEDHAVNVDHKQYVLEQVMALPASESQVIFLHYYKDMTIDEISYMMEISKSTVKRYLASGKKHHAALISA